MQLVLVLMKNPHLIRSTDLAWTCREKSYKHRNCFKIWLIFNRFVCHKIPGPYLLCTESLRHEDEEQGTNENFLYAEDEFFFAVSMIHFLGLFSAFSYLFNFSHYTFTLFCLPLEITNSPFSFFHSIALPLFISLYLSLWITLSLAGASFSISLYLPPVLYCMTIHASNATSSSSCSVLPHLHPPPRPSADLPDFSHMVPYFFAT